MKSVHENSTRIEWLLVAGGFHDRGGQDKANAALARYLARRGDRITILSHEIDPEFGGLPNVRCVLSPRVLNSSIASDLMLAPRAHYQLLLKRGARVRVVANGGNVVTNDINWVHFVHRSWQEHSSGLLTSSRLRDRVVSGISSCREGKAFRKAQLLIANSERTRQDLLRYFPIEEKRVQVVWLGSEVAMSPVPPRERLAARAKFGIVGDTPVAVFVGALGKDDRKGFSTLFEAWSRFSTAVESNPVLLVAGRGDAFELWEEKVKSSRCEQSIKMLGFRTDIADILATADVLISPARYEAYGLNVHEALSLGIPALVSRSAGVADRYPSSMAEMLIEDPTSSAKLHEKLLAWVSNKERWHVLASEFGACLREWTWDDMAERIVRLAERRLD